MEGHSHTHCDYYKAPFWLRVIVEDAIRCKGCGRIDYSLKSLEVFDDGLEKAVYCQNCIHALTH